MHNRISPLQSSVQLQSSVLGPGSCGNEAKNIVLDFLLTLGMRRLRWRRYFSLIFCVSSTDKKSIRIRSLLFCHLRCAPIQKSTGLHRQANHVLAGLRFEKRSFGNKVWADIRCRKSLISSLETTNNGIIEEKYTQK